MPYLTAIDGACRRNGKPNCVSAGGAFIVHADNASDTILSTRTICSSESGSTNQRGELLALIDVLKYAVAEHVQVCVVTDSEYIFNGIYWKWFVGWRTRGWYTAGGDAVKNQDLWQIIAGLVDTLEADDIEPTVYHIKGHCISFGKVTATHELNSDTTGMSLYNRILSRYDESLPLSNQAEVEELFFKNNKFHPDLLLLRKLISFNIVADAVATRCVEAADALIDK